LDFGLKIPNPVFPRMVPKSKFKTQNPLEPIIRLFDF